MPRIVANSKSCELSVVPVYKVTSAPYPEDCAHNLQAVCVRELMSPPPVQSTGEAEPTAGTKFPLRKVAHIALFFTFSRQKLRQQCQRAEVEGCPLTPG